MTKNIIIDALARDNNMTKQEYAEFYFKEQGCTLLEPYVDSVAKMKYICVCGEEASARWSSFVDGQRCGCEKDNYKPRQYLYI